MRVLNGIILNIQKYSIHDGPGIRTTVFFKGCPLNCAWCHNPESQQFAREIVYFDNRCTSCGKCVVSCPQNAIFINENNVQYNKNQCTLCEKCIDVCINNAREIAGKSYNVDQLMHEIQKDSIFYEESGGGVTFSGGEPLSQIAFLEEVLKKCKEKGIHTTLDTTVYSSWASIERIMDYTDLFLIDIKHMDSIVHKKYTTVNNELILENIKKLSALKKNIYIRVPIIPGINDDIENLSKLREFLSKLNIIQINLLPYHKIGMDKYYRIHMDYKLNHVNEPSQEYMSSIMDYLSEINIKIKIGG